MKDSDKTNIQRLKQENEVLKENMKNNEYKHKKNSGKSFFIGYTLLSLLAFVLTSTQPNFLPALKTPSLIGVILGSVSLGLTTLLTAVVNSKNKHKKSAYYDLKNQLDYNKNQIRQLEILMKLEKEYEQSASSVNSKNKYSSLSNLKSHNNETLTNINEDNEITK